MWDYTFQLKLHDFKNENTKLSITLTAFLTFHVKQNKWCSQLKRHEKTHEEIQKKYLEDSI